MQSERKHNGRGAGWSVSGLFLTAFLADTLIFTFHNWPGLPSGELSFFLPKISAALFFSAFVPLFRDRRWTVAFLFLFSFWILSNQVYLRSNGLCFDGYSSTLICNLKGFGGGILGLFEWFDLWYLAVLVVYATLLRLFGRTGERSLRTAAAVLLLSIVSGVAGMLMLNRQVPEGERCFNPFSARMHNRFPYINDYCREVSVAHLFIYDIADVARIMSGNESGVDVAIKPDEEKELALVLHPELKGERRQFSDTVVIILVESLESWAVREDIMPNLEEFTRRDNVLFAERVKPQILAGTSSDGQFIVNSGLLPIDHGAVCFAYPCQNYPSIASNARGKAMMLIPHSDKVWNQKQMSVAEGYDGTEQVGEEDGVIFGSVLDHIGNGCQVVHTLTISSHIPFTAGASRSSLKTPANMPMLMSNYVKCMNYTDANLQSIIGQTEEGGILHGATVVITGDHTIFYKDSRESMQKYCIRSGLPYRVWEPYCPLIIYSPHVSGNRRVEEECFQMDIYPTVMALLGNPDPVWDGFGINLAEEGVERRISAGRAMRLGNKVVRNDLFKDLKR